MKFLLPTLFLAALREAASADGQSSTIRGQQHQRGLEETSLVTVGNNGNPKNAFPLGRCQGDCDKDKDCSGNLVCFRRDGQEEVPGCTNQGEAGDDYCTDRPSSTYLARGYMKPLGLCVGHCEKDEHCEGDLVCFKRKSFDPVPGCDGDGDKGKDYCILLDAVTPPPTPPPTASDFLELCDDSLQDLDLSQAFEPLHVPPQIYPDANGLTEVTLVYNLVNYEGPAYRTILRQYNNIAPGPTIHVEAGGRLELKLINCLTLPLGFSGPESKNLYHVPNTTNLHTHGPHVSGEAPSDFIFANIGPQEMYQYEYDFDDNHMPGTFWYHPHFHGSTSLQTGQGTAGMIIMDEKVDYEIPDSIKNMPEIQMVFQHMTLDILRDAARISQDGITDWVDMNFEITNTSTDLTNFMLVNMQFLPKITMEVGKWYRWRMVMSSIRESLAFLSQSGNCEIHLLAKDGIFLSDAPRKVPEVMLSPGNRADVAVRCSAVGQEFMNITDLDFKEGFGKFDPNIQFDEESIEVVDPNIPDLVGTFADPEAQPTIFIIDVTNTDDDLVPFGQDVPTPCYLVDLRNLEEDQIDGKFSNKYGCKTKEPGGWPHAWAPEDKCGVYGPYGRGDISDEAEPSPDSSLIGWTNSSVYINDFEVGTVQEIELKFIKFHPYHQHISPFQLQKIFDFTDPTETRESDPDSPLAESVKTWYQVGDWHDTLQLPAKWDLTSVLMRFQADLFTGKMVQHCHLLFHEDQGMMAQYKITGEEFTTWPGAREINPTCIEASSVPAK